MKKILLLSVLLVTFLISGCTNNKDTKIILPYRADTLNDEDIEYIKSDYGLDDIIIGEDGLVYANVSNEYLEMCKLQYFEEVKSIIDEIMIDFSDSINNIEVDAELTDFKIYLNSGNITSDEFWIISGFIGIGMEYQSYLEKNPFDTNIYVTVLDSNNEVIEEFIYPEFYEDIEKYLEEYLEEYLSEHEHTHDDE